MLQKCPSEISSQFMICFHTLSLTDMNECRVLLKCHWDQNFGIPYFCIFENSLRLLVTMPNFNSLRRLEVAFFGRFLSRFYGRHYWPLFRKPAFELAEVTSEAHLKLSTFHTVTCHGKFNSRRGKISCQLFAVRP